MFDPFKFWDEMLDIYHETVAKSKDEQTVDTVFLEFEVPKKESDRICAVVANWLADNDYDPEDFYAG